MERGGFSRPTFSVCGGGGRGTAPHFCRIMNNSFILPRSTHEDLKTLFLYKTFIDRVSNESVGFPAFNFAVCVTNFVAAGFHLKSRSPTHVSFHRQLQTSRLDLFRQLGRVLLGSTVSGWLGWLSCFVFYWQKTVFSWFGCSSFSTRIKLG